MRPSPTNFEPQACKLPKRFWLELASMALALALKLFATSKKLGRVGAVEWAAIGVLRLAGTWLGHAPERYCIEFRADLPVEI